MNNPIPIQGTPTAPKWYCKTWRVRLSVSGSSLSVAARGIPSPGFHIGKVMMNRYRCIGLYGGILSSVQPPYAMEHIFESTRSQIHSIDMSCDMDQIYLDVLSGPSEYNNIYPVPEMTRLKTFSKSDRYSSQKKYEETQIIPLGMGQNLWHYHMTGGLTIQLYQLCFRLPSRYKGVDYDIIPLHPIISHKITMISQ